MGLDKAVVIANSGVINIAIHMTLMRKGIEKNRSSKNRIVNHHQPETSIPADPPAERPLFPAQGFRLELALISPP